MIFTINRLGLLLSAAMLSTSINAEIYVRENSLDFEKKHNMAQKVEYKGNKLTIINPWKNYTFKVKDKKNKKILIDDQHDERYILEIRNNQLIISDIDNLSQKFIFRSE